MTKRERNMLVVVGVLAVGALAYLVLFLGGGEPEEETAPTPTSSPPEAVAPPEDVESPEPPRAVTFFGGRDPFVPLVEEPTEPTNGETPPSDGETPPSDGETPPANGETPPANGDDGIAVTGRPIVLVDVIDESTVQVEVEGEPFTVTEGERFAGSYQVASVDANCARFLYGDESFSLCEGQPPK